MCSERSAPAAGSCRGRRRGASFAAAALLVGLATFGGLAGCGKRGDPSPPLRYVPQTTDQLTVSQRHLDLVLELPYPKTTAAGMALPGLSRIEVWEVRRTAPGGVPPVDAATAAAGDPPAESGEEEAATSPAEEAAPEDDTEVPTEEVPEAEPAESEAFDGETAAPQPVIEPAGPDALDPRAFVGRATLRHSIEAPELSDVVIGERIVIPLPLPEEFPEVPEAHYFAIRTVVGEDDRSELSNQAVIVPQVPPAPPGQLAAEAGPGGVRLTWQGDGPGVVGYDVYRRSARERIFLDPVARLGADASEAFDASARFGESYIYGVTAVVSRQPLIASAIGETVEVDYRDRFPPAPPSGLVALVEEDRVRLVWEASGAADLAGHRIERSTAGGPFVAMGDGLVRGSEWVDEAVSAGTSYTWRVASVDRDGNRSQPAEVTAEAR